MWRKTDNCLLIIVLFSDLQMIYFRDLVHVKCFKNTINCAVCTVL